MLGCFPVSSLHTNYSILSRSWACTEITYTPTHIHTHTRTRTPSSTLWLCVKRKLHAKCNDEVHLSGASLIEAFSCIDLLLLIIATDAVNK